jgi:hypothetical protein
MDKRYQVFISSTFKDLVDERQATLKAVLEIDHMPAGMELFPAVDDTAWELIKDVIDGSDYYILILGGRYGSLDVTGIGYTEKEYDYAVSQKKPVIPLLHKNPDNLPRGKTETDKTAWEKLKAFRERVEERHTCVYWESHEDLKAKVIVGLTTTIKRHPTIGWVRADQIPSDATVTDLLLAKQRISELENELSKTRSGPPPGSEKLMQGEDVFSIKIEFEAYDTSTYESTSYSATVNPTWNEIFSFISPVLMNEAKEAQINSGFLEFIASYGRKAFEKDKDLKGRKLRRFKVSNTDFQTCIVQLRALGLIAESQKKRSVKDTNSYWQLASYGDQLMVQLRALHREAVERKPSGQKSEE